MVENVVQVCIYNNIKNGFFYRMLKEMFHYLQYTPK